MLRSLRFFCLVAVVGLCGEASIAIAQRLPERATGASEAIFADPPDRVLLVDPKAGDDVTANGSPSKPYRTLGTALELARPLLEKNQKIKILLRPGVYREETFFKPKNPESRGYLIIEATEKHQAILSGSDDWSGDQGPGDGWRDEGGGVFSKPWTFDWGFDSKGFLHGPATEFDESVVARREFVRFGDQSALRQVLTRNELEPGCFCVDETADKLFLIPPQGADPARDRVEVGVRPVEGPWGGMLFGFWNTRNLKLSGLSFQNAATYPNGASLSIGRRSSNAVVENCEFHHNGSGGMHIAHDGDNFRGVTDLTIRNVSAHDNGASGLFGGCNNGLIQNCRFERNNVRGNWTHFFGWSLAGAKLVRCQKVAVDRCLFADNMTGGLWFDVHCRNALVNQCVIRHNFGLHPSGEAEERGLFFEISEGPLLVRKCEISQNYVGMQVGNSENVTVQGCKIWDNQLTQIGLECRPRGDDFPSHNANLHFVGNTIAGRGDQLLVSEVWSADDDRIERSRKGLKLTEFENNRYFHKDNPLAFTALDLKSGQGKWQTVTFNRWKQLTDLDVADSLFNRSPKFGGAAGAMMQTAHFDHQSGIDVLGGGIGSMDERDGKSDWVGYADFDLGDGAKSIEVELAVDDKYAGSQLEIRLDGPRGRLVGRLDIRSTGGWKERRFQTTELRGASGVHDLYLVAKGGKNIGNLYRFIVRAADANKP